MPLTLGHENAGTVSAIGGGVHAVKEGDRVAVYGGWGDGFCDYCVAGEENLCPTMQWVGLSQHEGGYAEYLLVPHERYLVKLNTLEPKAAAPLTDAALTPYRAIKRALPHVRPDYPVLVIGCGALGQFGVKILRLLSGAEIIAVDLDDGKLKIARESGATHAINARDPEVAQKILEIARGIGVSAAFDFVGADSTLALAMASTRTAGRVVQVGLAGATAHVAALKTVKPEVSVSVSWWGNIRELREVLALAESGRLTPIPLENLLRAAPGYGDADDQTGCRDDAVVRAKNGGAEPARATRSVTLTMSEAEAFGDVGLEQERFHEPSRRALARATA